MSLSRLSAGSGYRYLLKNIAVGDIELGPRLQLTAYYAASDNPPGRWIGAGLPGLGTADGRDLGAGAAVTEEAMARLFGSGHDPVTGERLGLAYPQFKTAAERIAAHVGRLPEDLAEAARTEVIAEIETRELARPARSAVAGYDLTFTVPKSVSVLWALGDPDTRQAVEDAHRDAVAAVLGLVEERFLHTRIGEGSKIRVPAHGAIAAAFDHYDTRAGDPNLHTHLVIANKVQGPDGRWRAVDGQVLFQAAVACSEIYDAALADILASRLPVSFGYRDRGPRRTPAYEIEGIPDSLLTAFSSRSQEIGTHLQDLVAAFTDSHGREPSRVETLKLRQQATLATRPDKHVTSLAELRTGWQATAETLTGQAADAIARTTLTSTNSGLSSIVSTASATGHAGAVPEGMLARYADAVVAAVSQRRATWTATNLLAEAARATRALRLPDVAARIALVDQIVAAALDLCIALDPPRDSMAAERYTHRAVGASAEAPEPAYTAWAILAAEARLLTAHSDDTAAPLAGPQSIEALAAARPTPGHPRLSAEQARAAGTIAASGRRLDVLVGPAGTGKTRALCALRAAWEHTHGTGTVIGLAPSATAAAELAASLSIGADTLAKWIHQSDAATAGGTPWRLRAGQLIIIDEAAMAPTAQLDAVVAQAVEAGAKVVLAGDPFQLGSVDTGGTFALLVGEGHGVELEQLHRFSHDWEAAATRQLRIGDPACLDAYSAHGRLHEGPAEAMTERAYRGWAADTAAGLASLLLAADRDTVTALNRRVRTDRLRTGQVDPGVEVALHDGTSAAVGDHIITRRNDRRLAHPDGAHVRNGDRWIVRAVHSDGSLDAITRPGPNAPASAAVRLPADYVCDHVELGYALTVHRAQGATVDTTHLVAQAGMGREALYVGLTRGREANHAYITTDVGAFEPHTAEHPPSGQQVLETLLRSPGAQTSATSVLRHRQAEHVPALAGADAGLRFSGNVRGPGLSTSPRRRPSSTDPHRPPPSPGLSR